ncbi:MAG: hypothetical protein M9932_04635 [Xanthobacteraceae bacterium]|nr:hypothetical protein [Xanthobacteraceae bacterium]
MATDVTIQVEPSGPYISALASAVNEARNFRDAAQSTFGATTATAAAVLADRSAAEAAQLAAEAAKTAAAASASSAVAAKDGAAAALAAANVVLTHDRYRDQLDDWRALGAPQRPSLLQRFTDNTYFLRDKIVTSDFSAFLAAANGSFTRASGGTMLGSAGNLIEFAAGAPRITDLGMATERNGTNFIRNPRFEGAVPGSPGTLPTFMGWVAPAGITREVVGVGSENGIPGIYLRIFGTTTAAGPAALYFEYGGVISALVNDTITSSVYLKSVAGTPIPLRLISNEYDSAVTYLAGGFSTFTPAPVLQRTTYIRTLSSPIVSSVSQTIAAQLASGQTIDFTFFVGGPQCEKAPFASSLILPPAGSPAQSTRAVDSLKRTRSSPAALSKLIRARTAPGIDSSRRQYLWMFDDTTSNNQLYLARYVDRTMNFRCTSGGSIQFNINLGEVGDNTDVALAFRATGNDFAVCLNGGTVVTNTSAAMPPGLVREWLSLPGTTDWDGLVSINAEFKDLLTNQDLQRLTA